MIRYPRGSEWRLWDLHVHTPFSALSNGFGSNFDDYAKELFQTALRKEVAAIGVTDYFLLEGYRRLRELISAPGKLEALLGDQEAENAREILLVPNVELRSSVIIRRSDGSDSRVNFHVLFDETIDPETLEEHFLRELQFTAESNPSSADDRWSLTETNLSDLGRRLKSEHAAFRSLGDLHVGMMNAVIAHEDVTQVLERQASRFAGRYLLVVPADEDLSEASWDGQGHQTRKVFIQKAHMLFSANKGTRDFGLGKRHPSVDAFLDEFKSRKPCIHGSDAHNYDSLFAPSQDRYLWIKADPTFQGLRQLLFEPETRVYLGDQPPSLSRLKEKATKYMTSITFERDVAATDEAKWFSGSLPLNHGLIAIIGNKGSGKSALADILALLGDTRNSEHFSFLTDGRFLAQKRNLGDLFRAEVQWHSAQKRSRKLSERVDHTLPEIVKYIPQHYLEEICSELMESHDPKVRS